MHNTFGKYQDKRGLESPHNEWGLGKLPQILKAPPIILHNNAYAICYTMST